MTIAQPDIQGLFEPIPFKSELHNSTVYVPSPAFDGRRFSLESPPNRDEALFVDEYNRGTARFFWEQTGLDITGRLPRPGNYGFFDTPEHMRHNLEAAGFSIQGDESGVTLGGLAAGVSRRMLIGRGPSKRDTFTAIGHEATHYLHPPGWTFAGSAVLREAMVDLWTGHVMRDWCIPSRGDNFVPSYLGLAVVADELIRSAASSLSTDPNRVFRGVAQEMAKGSEVLGRAVMHRLFGDASDMLLKEIDERPIESVDDIFDIALRLNLPDAYRRLMKRMPRPIVGLITAKWVRRSEGPSSPARSFTQEEINDIKGPRPPSIPESPAPDEPFHRPAYPAGTPSGDTSVGGVKDELDAVSGDIQGVATECIGPAVHSVQTAEEILIAAVPECRDGLDDTKRRIMSLEAEIAANERGGVAPSGEMQAQLSSLKVELAQLTGLMTHLDSLAAVRGVLEERLGMVHRLLDETGRMILQYKQPL